MKNTKKVLFALLGLAFGGGLGVILAMHTDTAGELALSMLLLFAAGYTQLILHEAGHLIAGLLSGYSFVSFRIGSLTLIKSRGRFRLARYRLAGTGGQCLMAPPPLRNGDYPAMLYHLGGVIMNLLCAALAALMLLWRGYSAWWLGTLVIGLVMACTNGIPLKTAAVDNDGRNALRGRREPDVRLGFYRQLQVNRGQADGMRLRDMPADWFECAPGQEHERGYLRFQYLLDSGAYADARQYGARLLDCPMPGLHRALLENDLRCLALLAGETPAVPDKVTRQLWKSMAATPSMLRGNYMAALLWEHDTAKAEKLKAQFNKTLETYPYPGDIATDAELIRKAQEKLKEGRDKA